MNDGQRIVDRLGGAIHRSLSQHCPNCEAQAAEIEKLRDAVKEAIAFLKTAPLESGYCCCGDPMSGHNMWSGHSPVDELGYHAHLLQESLSAALGETK